MCHKRSPDGSNQVLSIADDAEHSPFVIRTMRTFALSVSLGGRILLRGNNVGVQAEEISRVIEGL